MEKANLIIYGRVIALSNVEEIASKEAGKPAMKKRKLFLDCTRYDSITGEKDDKENKPLLEFGGDKVVEKLGALNLEKGDVVMVRFAIQGVPYKNQQGKTDVFTSIRCYDCELIRKANQPAQGAAPVPEPQPAPATEQKPNDGGLPF